MPASIVRASSVNASSSITPTVTPASGNLLVLVIRKNGGVSGAPTAPAGWTVDISVGPSPGSSNYFRIFCKPSDGTESGPISVGNMSDGSRTITYYELNSTDPGIWETHRTSSAVSTNVNSISTGTTSATTQPNAVAIAGVAISSSFNGGETINETNGFSERHFSAFTGETADKVLSTVGSVETTFSISVTNTKRSLAAGLAVYTKSSSLTGGQKTVQFNWNVQKESAKTFLFPWDVLSSSYVVLANSVTGSSSITPSATPVAGNLIVIVASKNGGVAGGSPTAPAGWNTDLLVGPNVGSSNYIRFFSKVSDGTESGPITVGNMSDGSRTITFYQITSPNAGVWQLHRSTSAVSSSAVNSISTGTTTVTSEEVAVAIASVAMSSSLSGGETISETNGFSERFFNSFTGETADKSLNSIGAVETTFTISGATTRNMVASLVVYAKVATGDSYNFDSPEIVFDSVDTTFDQPTGVDTQSKNIISSWDVRQQATKFTTFEWGIKESGTKSFTFSWNANASLEKRTTFVWNVASSTVFEKFTGISWNVQQTRSKLHVLVWDVQGVGQPGITWADWSTLSWGDLSTTRWNGLSAFTSHTKEIEFSWNIRQENIEQLIAQWDIQQAFSKSLTFLWNVQQQGTEVLTVVWNVQAYTQHSKSTTFVWNVVDETLKLIGFQWNVKKEGLRPTTFVWDVQGTPFSGTKFSTFVWNIGITRSKSTVLLWNVQATTLTIPAVVPLSTPVVSIIITNPVEGYIDNLENAGGIRVLWELNGPGSCEWTMSADDPKVVVPEPARSHVQVWISGRLRWRGILWNVQNSPKGSTFSAQGHLSSLFKRFIDTATLQITNIDQLDIPWELIKYAQGGEPAVGNRELLMRKGSYFSDPNLGHRRSRLYKREEHRNIYDALQEFPTLDDGFDFELKFDETGQDIFLYYTPMYPRGYSEFGSLDFEWGGNVNNFEVQEYGQEIVTENYATGGSANNVKFENKFTDTDAENYYLKKFQSVSSHGGVLDVDWLLDHAKDEVVRRRVPQIIPKVTALRFPTHHIDDPRMKPGNPAKLVIRKGRVNIADYYRIITVEWRPKEDVVDITLKPFWSPSGAFVSPRPT